MQQSNWTYRTLQNLEILSREVIPLVGGTNVVSQPRLNQKVHYINSYSPSDLEKFS